MSILGTIAKEIFDETIGYNVADKGIKVLDKKIEKNKKKLFEVGKGKKVLIVNQKLYTFKDMMNVFDENENIKYKVKGEFASLKRHLHVFNTNNIEIAEVKEKLIALRNPLSMQTRIADFDFIVGGKKMAKLKSKTFFKDKLELDNGWIVKGNITGFKYSIFNKEGKEIAKVSTKLLYFGDTYKVEYDENVNELLILLIVLAMDIFHAPSKKEEFKDAVDYHLWHW